jgi:hypothetical protein
MVLYSNAALHIGTYSYKSLADDEDEEDEEDKRVAFICQCASAITRHYLSEAISKCKRNSAEYDFLSRKLCSVEVELQASSSNGDIDDDEQDRLDHVDRVEVSGDDDHADPYLDFPSHDVSSKISEKISGGHYHDAIDDVVDDDDDDFDKEGDIEHHRYYDNARGGNHRRNIVIQRIIDTRESASRRCSFGRLGYLISIILMAWTLALIVATKKESSQLSSSLVDNLESTTGVSSEG